RRRPRAGEGTDTVAVCPQSACPDQFQFAVLHGDFTSLVEDVLGLTAAHDAGVHIAQRSVIAVELSQLQLCQLSLGNGFMGDHQWQWPVAGEARALYDEPALLFRGMAGVLKFKAVYAGLAQGLQFFQQQLPLGLAVFGGAATDLSIITAWSGGL